MRWGGGEEAGWGGGGVGVAERGEAGIKPSWRMHPNPLPPHLPLKGAFLLKLFSCADDSKQGGGEASGREVPSAAALSR